MMVHVCVRAPRNDRERGGDGARVLQCAGELWEVQVFIIYRYRCALHGAAWLNPCTGVLRLLRDSILGKKTPSGTTKSLYFFPKIFFCAYMLLPS